MRARHMHAHARMCSPAHDVRTERYPDHAMTHDTNADLKLLTGSLVMVGYSETLQGITKVTMSFIAGQ